jgi:hypothetical protein
MALFVMFNCVCNFSLVPCANRIAYLCLICKKCLSYVINFLGIKVVSSDVKEVETLNAARLNKVIQIWPPFRDKPHDCTS